MTITISASGISLDGPLVAGEKVAVSVSGLSFTTEDKPTLALLARFPDALLASVELAESETAGTWTGELDTATKQTALFFATARADERRDAALELVAGRVSLARLTVPMANSALCPKPDGSPFASPVYIPVPGPPGKGGDPYDQAPEMDGEASAGTADEYARGDHVHPTDTSRASAADVAAIQGIIPSTATPTNKLATAADIPAEQVNADWEAESGVAQILHKPSAMTPTEHAGTHHSVDGSDPLDGSVLNVGGSGSYSGTSIATTIDDINTILGGKADASSLAAVATSGDYDDLTNKPTIPAAQVNADWNASSGVAQILNKPTIPDISGKADSASIAPAFSASSTYAVGDYATHEGVLYKCTTAVSTAGAWNAANWSAVSAMGEMPAPITVDSAMSSSSTNPVQNKVVNTAIGGLVPWANANKNAVSIGPNTTVSDKSLVVGNSNSASGVESIAAGWNNSASGNHSFAFGQEHAAQGANAFAVGENCYAWGKDSFAGGYRARTNPNNYGAGHWGAFVWNGGGGNSWYSSHGDGTFNVNTQSGASGFYIGETTLATLLGAKAESADLRYSFASPTPSVSGTAATVACEDRAINDFTVATGITSLTITPPDGVTGRARDFFCRVTLTDSSLPTVTLSGGTIDIGASEVAGMTQGVNLLMFTEIASGHWLASRRSAS